MTTDNMTDLSPLVSVLDQSKLEGMLITDESGRIHFQHQPCVLTLSERKFAIFSTKKGNRLLREFSADDLIGMDYHEKKGMSKDKHTFEVNIYLYPVQTSIFSCFSTPKQDLLRKRVLLRLLFHTPEQVCRLWWNAIQRVIRGGVSLNDVASLNDFDTIAATLQQRNSTGTGRLSNPSIENYQSLTSRKTGDVTEQGGIPNYNSRKFIIFVNPVSGKGTAVSIWRKYVEPMLTEAGIDIELIITQRANHAKDFLKQHTNIYQYHAILIVGGDGLLFEVVNGIAERSDGFEVLQKVALLPIPGGSGNGLAKTILYQCGLAFHPRNATYVAIRGKSQPIDLSRVMTASGQTSYAFLMLTTGLVADIDILTEFMRCLGELRMFLGGAYFIMRRRKFTARLKLKLVDNHTYDDHKFAEKIEVNQLFDSDDRKPDNWVTLQGEFILIWIVQTSHVSASVLSGPNKKMNDGAFTVYVIQNMSRLELLGVMLAADNGNHVYNSKVRVFQCNEYIVDPISKEGLYSLDGEVVEYGKLHGKIVASGARILATSNPNA